MGLAGLFKKKKKSRLCSFTIVDKYLDKQVARYKCKFPEKMQVEVLHTFIQQAKSMLDNS